MSYCKVDWQNTKKAILEDYLKLTETSERPESARSDFKATANDMLNAISHLQRLANTRSSREDQELNEKRRQLQEAREGHQGWLEAIEELKLAYDNWVEMVETNNLYPFPVQNKRQKKRAIPQPTSFDIPQGY